MQANPAAVNRAANARMAWAANLGKMTKTNPGIWAAVAEAENPLSGYEIDHLSLAFDAVASGDPDYGQYIRGLYDIQGNPNEAAVLTEIANALARAEEADAPDLVFEALEYARLLLRRLPEGSEGRSTMKERLVQAVQRHVDRGNLIGVQRDFLTGKLKTNPGKRKAQSTAKWHRARGKRARVMPVAGGKYDVFLDGKRQARARVATKKRKATRVRTLKARQDAIPEIVVEGPDLKLSDVEQAAEIAAAKLPEGASSDDLAKEMGDALADIIADLPEPAPA